jgi:threonine synthase
MPKYVCVNCGTAYPEIGLPAYCAECGGVYTVTELNYDQTNRSDLPGMWKYKKLLGLVDMPITYLGEGQTAFVERKIDDRIFYAKLESLNPSGSFKDRKSAIVSSYLKKRGIEQIVEDSSGNAGGSLALYASAFGINAQIFIPEGTKGPKVEQCRRIGGSVVEVAGPRENAYLAVKEQCRKTGAIYASHALLPFGLTAYAMIAFEIFEQLGELPANIYCPIGHGSLFYGILLGFEAICKFLGKDHRPRMIGVQPERCSPLVKRWQGESFKQTEFSSAAEGTMVANPTRGPEILSSLKRDWDDLIAIPEKEILPVCFELARYGIYVEPTSAMVYAGLLNHGAVKGKNVLVFSGNGLKYSQQ